MQKISDVTCNICGNAHCETIYQTQNDNLARYGLLASPQTSGNNVQLSQDIAYCPTCNYAWNMVYEPKNVVYASDSIIEAGHFSPRYMTYQKESSEYLCNSITGSIDLAIEIGAGAGIFLSMVKASRKVAFEPSDESKLIDPSIEVVNDYFSAGKIDSHVNAVILRQVLEHIALPQEFLKSVMAACDRDSKQDFYIYLEVPNAEFTFNKGRFYDFYYEHCNHFSLQSLFNIANNLGLHMAGVRSEMDGELICVLLKRGKATDKSASLIGARIDQTEQRLHQVLDAYKGEKILAWGACGNGTVALNKLGVTIDTIPFVIDSDIHKQGKYIPGTNQKIISPHEASQYQPNLIIIFSQLHKTEIMRECRRIFGADPVLEIL